MSLISHGKVKALPGYRAMVVQKLQRFCFEYQFFENICTMDSSDKDLAQEIMNHLQAHHAVFFKVNLKALIIWLNLLFLKRDLLMIVINI